MRAIRCLAHGEPEALVLDDVPVPTPGAGEVLVAVEAAAVNYPDALIVQNRYQLSFPPPFVPGTDFAGTVQALGPGVAGVAVGDRVFGIALGALAEAVVVPAGALRPMPATIDATTAAAFPTAYETAYDAVRTTAAMAAGATLVVLGAGGGVGSAAVQIGALLGARVIACAASEAKLAVARALGADACLRYDTPRFKERLKALVPEGADAVIDPVGGPYSEPALRATGYGGRFVVVGFASGEIPRLPLNLVLLKGVLIVGYEIASFRRERPEVAARNRREVLGHLAAGRLVPHVSRRIALAEVPAALRDALERRVIGKIVVDVRR